MLYLRTGLISWCEWPEFYEVWKGWAWEGALWGWEQGAKPVNLATLWSAVMPSTETTWSILQFPLQKSDVGVFAPKRSILVGKGLRLVRMFRKPAGFQLPFLTLLKGILSWPDRLTQIQRHQQGGLSGSLPWQPLHLLPPLLLEVKNQVFCLIRPRTHLLRVFSPVIKLFGSRMYHLNPFCSEKWG